VADVFVSISTAGPGGNVNVATKNENGNIVVYAEKLGGATGASFPLVPRHEGVAHLHVSMLITKDDGQQVLRQTLFRVNSTSNP
jgi:hypothetical protein